MRSLLLLSALLFLAACTKDQKQTAAEECVYECDEMPIAVQIDAGFYTPEEMDTVIIKKYLAGGTFTPLQDQSLIVITDTGQYADKGAVVSGTIHSGIDYEIVIPGTGQTYRIQSIVKPYKTETINVPGGNCNVGHFQCYVPIRDCTVSGGNYDTVIIPGGAMSIMLKH